MAMKISDLRELRDMISDLEVDIEAALDMARRTYSDGGPYSKNKLPNEYIKFRLVDMKRNLNLAYAGINKAYDNGMGWSISPETLAKYERGESEATISDTKKIAKALGVTPAYLVGWDGDTWYKEQPTRHPDDANLYGLEDEISFADAYLSKSYDLYREIYLGTVKDFGEDDGVLANLHFADVGIGIASARHDLIKAQRAMKKAIYCFNAKKKRGNELWTYLH